MRRLLPRLLLLGLAAAVIVVVFVGLGQVMSGGPAPLTAPVGRDTLETTVELTGTITPRDARTLTFGTGGTVATLLVAEGDRVTAGDTLATLDDTLVRVQVTAAEAALAGADARLAADRGGPTKLDRTVARDPVRQAAVSVSAAGTAASDARRQGDAAVKAARAQQDAAQARLSADLALAAPAAVIAADRAAVSAADAAVRQAKLQRSAAIHQASSSVSAARAALTAARHAYQLRVAAAPDALIKADEAAVASAALSLASARQALDLTTIRAPIDGTVTDVGFEVGDRVAPTTSAALSLGAAASAGATGAIELMTLDELQVETTASEIDVPALRVGQSVELTLDAIPDLAATARICQLGRVGQQAQGVVEYPVTICLTDTGGALRVGMSADGSVPVERRQDVLVVPGEAIRDEGGQSLVDVLEDDGTIRTVTIQTGLTSGSRVEVVSGLSQGQLVVLPALPVR